MTSDEEPDRTPEALKKERTTFAQSHSHQVNKLERYISEARDPATVVDQAHAANNVYSAAIRANREYLSHPDTPAADQERDVNWAHSRNLRHFHVIQSAQQYCTENGYPFQILNQHDGGYVLLETTFADESNVDNASKGKGLKTSSKNADQTAVTRSRDANAQSESPSGSGINDESPGTSSG